MTSGNNTQSYQNAMKAYQNAMKDYICETYKNLQKVAKSAGIESKKEDGSDIDLAKICGISINNNRRNNGAQQTKAVNGAVTPGSEGNGAEGNGAVTPGSEGTGAEGTGTVTPGSEGTGNGVEGQQGQQGGKKKRSKSTKSKSSKSKSSKSKSSKSKSSKSKLSKSKSTKSKSRK
jgi:hypothetical protein